MTAWIRAALLAGVLAAGTAAGTAAGAQPPAAAPRPGTLTLQLLDYDSRQPAVALVRLSDGERDLGPAGPGGWFALRGRLALPLAPGRYRLRVDGGRRRLPYDAEVAVRAGAIESRTVYLRQPEHLAFERSGWLAADPLVASAGSPAAEAALAAEAAGVLALGLERPRPEEVRALRGGLPVFAWEGAADPRSGSRLVFRGPAEQLAGYADCGRPRRFNPWETAVPWDQSLGRFYEMLASRPLATRGLAPRMYYELAAGAPVGCFELDGSESAERLWFALLRQGYRLPAVAGSRAGLRAGERPAPRMLVRLPARPAGSTWTPGDALVSALAAGQSTLSFGPFCMLQIDGRGPGAELPAVEQDRRLKISAAASTERRAEISRVELYRDGELLRRFDVPAGHVLFEPELVIRQEEPAWFVAKCWQRVRAAPGAQEAPETCAITNPVRVESAAYSTRPAPAVTRVSGRLLDAGTGQELAAELRGTGAVVAREGLEALPEGPRPAPAGEWCFRCPSGRFVMDVSAAGKILVSAPGCTDRSVDLVEELGLENFARRHAAMTPEEAERSLCDPGTLELLRKAMRGCDLTVRLQRAGG
jgi:hypothetical protein